MIPFLIGIGVGVIVDELLSTNKKDVEKDKYFVFVESKIFGKNTMVFNKYEAAKEIFDKIASKKQVIYGDLVDFDPLENKLYNRWVQEGNIGKEDYPSGLFQKSKIYEVSIGLENETFETKSFK